MKKFKLTIVSVFVILMLNLVFRGSIVKGQISITPNGADPDNSSMLDIQATDKGLLIPRMTTAQRNAISNPANSLLIFNTTTECFEAYHAGTNSWKQIACLGCQLPGSFSASAATNVSSTGFTANWSASSGATGYYLDVATCSGFTGCYVSGYQNLNVGNVTSYNVTGLTCNTTYYYRVRAYNSCGTSGNSNTITVTTGACGPSCGSQVWMLANMDVGTMINDPAEQNNDSQVEKYCYNNTASNCTTYGGLYQWAEAMQFPYSYNSSDATPDYNCDPCGSSGRQGICPSGYHIPTDLEFSRYEWCVETTISPTGSTSLSTFQNNTGYRGSNSSAGPGHKMKVTSSNTPGWDGSNASGFSALPAGCRYNGGGFFNLDSYAYFWTATESSANNAWYRGLSTGDFQSYRHTYKTYGFSVRCLQN